MATIDIRPWSPEVPVSAITALLHSAYAPLAAMGLRFLATRQDDCMTLQRLSRGWAFLAYSADELVGTICFYHPDTRDDCVWYRQPGVFSFGQFGVLPSYQRQGIGRTLLDYVEARAVHEGAHELALDTAEGATHLIRWYQGLGYRQVDLVSWHDTNYRSVVLSKALPVPI
jgi:ribosomal protein S18 acetylase RimI-like enzyme